MFDVEVPFRKHTPEDQIRQLRADGLSLAAIAQQTGSTVAIVRRVVGKVDKDAIRRQQEAIARQINAEPLSWSEKVARWQDQTGTSGATFWRVLKRCGGLEERGCCPTTT